MEISKHIHFWKAYNARSPKNDVYICAAPLDPFQHNISCICYFINFSSVKLDAENNAKFDAVSSKRANFDEVQFLK